jgi:hypothetical protein
VPLCGVPDIGSEDTGSSVAGLLDHVTGAFLFIPVFLMPVGLFCN